MNNILNNLINYYKNNKPESYNHCSNFPKHKDWNPLCMWYCGERANEGIMFVGKTAVTESDENFILPEDEDLEKVKSWLKNEKFYSIFWTRIYNIASKHLKNSFMEKICVTNLVKCNSGTNDDLTSEKMLNACLHNGYLLKELEIIKPKCVIFFLNSWYLEKIKYFEKKYSKLNITELFERKLEDKSCRMPVCTFKIGKNNIPCLLIGHPQGKNKEKYLKVVDDFLNKINFDN